MTGFADKGTVAGALISLAAVMLASVSWVARADDLQIMLEEPVDGQAASGVSNIRGWAIASEGVDRIEVWHCLTRCMRPRSARRMAESDSDRDLRASTCTLSR